LPARLFTFNSISTRYSVIMLAIISKLCAPILTPSLNGICSFYRVARDARGVYPESAQSRRSIARMHRRRRLAASHLRSSFPSQCLCVLRGGTTMAPDAYCIQLRRPLFLGIATESGLRFIRCIITRHVSYALDLCCPLLCKDQFQRKPRLINTEVI